MSVLLAYNLLTANDMAQSDPHGWILTLTSISVVFGALIILWVIFGLLGNFFSRKSAPKAPSADEAAAIAMAFEAHSREDSEEEVAAAVAMALERYLGESVHDTESYTLTLRPSAPTAWSNPARNFRKNIK